MCGGSCEVRPITVLRFKWLHCAVSCGVPVMHSCCEAAAGLVQHGCSRLAVLAVTECSDVGGATARPKVDVGSFLGGACCRRNVLQCLRMHAVKFPEHCVEQVRV